MSSEPAVTVVVVTWEGAHLLPECLRSLAAQDVPHRVLVVDNASTDGTGRLLRESFPDVEVLALDRNTGFAGGVAAALPLVRTDYVALLNNDAAAEPGWLADSLSTLEDHPAVAAATARMRLATAPGEPLMLNNAGVLLLADGYGADRGLGEPDGPAYNRPAEVFGFSGGAAVLRTSAVRAVGGMPAEFFLYYEDTDLAWRLRLAGWGVRYVPGAIVRHRHAATSDPTSVRFAYHNERNRLLMLVRCAPLGFAVGQLGRFGLTTASLAARRLARQRLADAANFRVGLRLRVLGAVLRRLPWALRTRRRIGKLTAARSGARKATARRWLGVVP